MTELKQNPVRPTKCGAKSGAEPVLSGPASYLEAKMNTDSAGDLSASRIATTPDIVAGLGLRSAAQCDEILDLLDTALATTGHDRTHLAALATLDGKHSHPALLAAATLLDVPLIGLPATALCHEVPNPSLRVAHHLALPSVAEAAALVFGPLLVEKQRSANATCALSRRKPSYATPRSSALSAASMLSTSSAGP